MKNLQLSRESDQESLGFGFTAVDLATPTDEGTLLLHHAKGNGAKERAAQWQALLEVAKAGKARHVGVSNYDLAQLKALQAG